MSDTKLGGTKARNALEAAHAVLVKRLGDSTGHDKNAWTIAEAVREARREVRTVYRRWDGDEIVDSAYWAWMYDVDLEDVHPFCYGGDLLRGFFMGRRMKPELESWEAEMDELAAP